MFDMPEAQTDDLDPSRPFHASDAPEYQVEEELDPLRTDLGGGFTDSTRSVRVWGDEFGRVRRVRLSLRWKERLPRAEQLSFAFSEAIRQLQYRFAEGDFLPQAPRLEVGRVDAFSFEAAERLIEEMLALRERGKHVAPVRLVGGGSVGTSQNRKVKVALGPLGDTTSVEFDEAWLEAARGSEIAAEVLMAHEDAYRRFEQPTLDAAEYLQIKSEFQRVIDEIDAMARQN